MDYFRETVRLIPGQDKGYLGLARVSSSTGDAAGALGIIREGLRNVQDNWLLLSKEAYLLHGMGDIAAADTVYRQAIAREPYAVENYVNLGILLIQQGKDAEFAAVVGQLRKINPDEADNLAKMSK